MSGDGRRVGELIGVLEARGHLRNVVSGSHQGPAALRVTRVDHDSRSVVPGSLFVAVPGANVDGHDYAAAACESGAVAVVVEHAVPGLAVPQLVVREARPAMATAAAWVVGFPSLDLGVVGITGTDGKTTTSFLVRAMLEACGLPTGIVGTVTVLAGGKPVRDWAHSTTPEAPELQRDLAAMRDAGDRFAVVEATSHGLAQDRVAEVAWDIGVITNLTHEHLEFHRTHEAYRAAKRRLFGALAVSAENPAKGRPKTGVVNSDDRWAEEFAEETRGSGARLLRYGGAPDADVRLTRLGQDARSLRLGVATPRWSGDVTLQLAGRFNAHNALAAIGVGEALELDPERMRGGLEAMRGVPGRMERIASDLPFTVIVDFAHSPHALEVVLDDLAPVAAAAGGALVAVFGSAGERDVVKRRAMGRVAGERCRLVVATDEDPRGEDRDAILEEIAAGAEEAGRRRGHDLLVIPDREEAVNAALEAARPGDVVVLAGKGHERTIEMADGPRPWDERAVAEAAIVSLGGHLE